MTSLRRWATYAAASFPSMVTVTRSVCLLDCFSDSLDFFLFQFCNGALNGESADHDSNLRRRFVRSKKKLARLRTTGLIPQDGTASTPVLTFSITWRIVP